MQLAMCMSIIYINPAMYLKEYRHGHYYMLHITIVGTILYIAIVANNNLLNTCTADKWELPHKHTKLLSTL